MEKVQKLFNRNFILMSVASLLMFIAFYLLMPIIAMYVVDNFGVDTSVAGVVVSAYIITALLTRPFSGYLVDRFDRRKFYHFTFVLFAALFTGYILSDSIMDLIITRILLGATFALVTTAASTLVIDVIPSSRRAEGIGYNGAITVLAMAIGPMLGLYLIEYFSYRELFLFAILCAWLGVGVAMFVRTKPRERVKHEPFSLDRFFLKEGVSIAFVVMLLYFFYGTLMTYVSLYVRECGVDISSATFFMLFAAGIIVSRISSAKLLHRGLFHNLLLLGTSIILGAGLLFVFYVTDVTFYFISVALGFGFGMVAPAIQSMIINLVPSRRRGTANSTYFIALDLGSGVGMLVGGSITAAYSYEVLYLIGCGLTVISLLFYLLYARRSYGKHLERAELERLKQKNLQ